MLARMAHWNCRPDCQDAAAALFERKALPILAGQAGALGAMLLAQPGTTERIALTLWADEASYRRFVESAAMREITEAFAPMYVDGALPVGSEFEVVRRGEFANGEVVTRAT
ncbi:MAG: antibiotic biosynthesis monooxygenase [Gammaproteobacteria bacterium]